MPRPYKDVRREILETFETDYVTRLMATCGGNLSAASRMARLSRRHLRDLLRKHGFYMELERRRARTVDPTMEYAHAVEQ